MKLSTEASRPFEDERSLVLSADIFSNIDTQKMQLRQALLAKYSAQWASSFPWALKEILGITRHKIRFQWSASRPGCFTH